MAAIWRRKESAKVAALASYVVLGAGDQSGARIPKGYVPMVLVGGGEEEETRVLVRVGALRGPCMAALLEMAEEQFGYGQQGVLRIPCDARQFEQMVNMHAKRCSQAA